MWNFTVTIGCMHGDAWLFSFRCEADDHALMELIANRMHALFHFFLLYCLINIELWNRLMMSDFMNEIATIDIWICKNDRIWSCKLLLLILFDYFDVSMHLNIIEYIFLLIRRLWVLYCFNLVIVLLSIDKDDKCPHSNRSGLIAM